MKNTQKQFTETDYEIRNEIYNLFALFGADSNILSAIGSWKDTLQDNDILSMLITYRNEKSDVTDNS